MKAQSRYCKLSLKAEENKGEIQEATASLPADKEINKDALQTKNDTEGIPGWKRWY